MTTERPDEAIDTLTADHGLTDCKGRRMGGVAWLSYAARYRCSLCGTINHWGCCADSRNGGARIHERTGEISLRVMPTRDGKPFGASSGATHYPTIEAARAAVVKKFAAQLTRYRRLAASGKL